MLPEANFGATGFKLGDMVEFAVILGLAIVCFKLQIKKYEYQDVL